MSIGAQLAKNTIWNSLEKFSVMGIQLLCTFILARFLTPSDYGIVGMLVVFTAISSTIVESGFGQALIREKDVSIVDYSTILLFNIVLSIIIYVVLFFASPYIAIFYHEPILEDVSKVTFLVIPCNALSIIQIAKYHKDLRFKELFFISLISSVLASIVAIYVAYKIKNVWALVLQNLLLFFFKTLFLWLLSDLKVQFTFSSVSFYKYFNFSKKLLLSGLIGSIFNNIYSLLIGRFYTSADLGYYSQADRLKNVTSHNSTSVIQGVTYPVLARIRNSGGDIRVAYRNIIITCLIFVGFIMSLIMGVSQNLLEVLMGSAEWRISGEYLIILGIAGILYPLHSVNLNIPLIYGEGNTILKLEIIRRCLMITVLLITLQFDIWFFVFGNVIYSILALLLNLYYCGKPINYTIKEQLSDIIPILLRFFIMIVLSQIVGHLLYHYNIFVNLFISVLTGLLSGVILFRKVPEFEKIIILGISLFKNKNDNAIKER